MVEVAPAPFDLTAATAPAKTDLSAPLETAPPAPHPLEAWSDRRGAIEPVIRSPLPGGGYVNATATALRKLADGEALVRRLAGPGIRHAVDYAAERQAREAEAEAQRKAGNPLAVLAVSHTLQAEAQTEVDRLTPLVERARDLVEDLTRRHAEARAAITDHHTVAAARLTEALAAGTAREALPTAPKTDSLEAAATATAGRLRIASDALQQLTTEMAAAEDLLTRRRHGVSRCALAVLADQAADIADEILDDAAALNERRADLDGLAMLLTFENRRLNARPAVLPSQIARALHPADRVLTGTARPLAASDWRAALAALVAGEQDESLPLARTEDPPPAA
jgi:hypothetical protein